MLRCNLKLMMKTRSSFILIQSPEEKVGVQNVKLIVQVGMKSNQEFSQEDCKNKKIMADLQSEDNLILALQCQNMKI